MTVAWFFSISGVESYVAYLYSSRAWSRGLTLYRHDGVPSPCHISLISCHLCTGKISSQRLTQIKLIFPLSSDTEYSAIFCSSRNCIFGRNAAEKNKSDTEMPETVTKLGPSALFLCITKLQNFMIRGRVLCVRPCTRICDMDGLTLHIPPRELSPLFGSCSTRANELFLLERSRRNDDFWLAFNCLFFAGPSSSLSFRTNSTVSIVDSCASQID